MLTWNVKTQRSSYRKVTLPLVEIREIKPTSWARKARGFKMRRFLENEFLYYITLTSTAFAVLQFFKNKLPKDDKER